MPKICVEASKMSQPLICKKKPPHTGNKPKHKPGWRQNTWSQKHGKINSSLRKQNKLKLSSTITNRFKACSPNHRLLLSFFSMCMALFKAFFLLSTALVKTFTNYKSLK